MTATAYRMRRVAVKRIGIVGSVVFLGDQAVLQPPTGGYAARIVASGLREVGFSPRQRKADHIAEQRNANADQRGSEEVELADDHQTSKRGEPDEQEEWGW